MKVKYHGESDPIYFLDGKIYEVIGIEGDWYRIIDETGEDYLYFSSKEVFEVVES